jgi:3',5'-cyclic AMP phosphodiesterase CpdA
VNRRSFLTSLAASIGIPSSLQGLPRGENLSFGQPSGAGRAAPSLRVAQLTDTHVFHERSCPARMRAFLARFREATRSPDVVLHTGDIIFDALEADRDAVTKQWALWHELARDLPSAPVYAIGNHDVWGKGPASDPQYGKKWAVDTLKLPERFYSFAKGGWHFIVLDSTHAVPSGWYTGKLDDEQLAWLEGELKKVAATTPIAVVSHIPILSAAIVQWARTNEDKWTVGTALMHGDSHGIQSMLRQHPNVKVCLSGHLHLSDHVVYDGIAYLGCGAVSANWWKSDTWHQTHAGFAAIDLYADGSFERTYHPYDWPAATED